MFNHFLGVALLVGGVPALAQPNAEPAKGKDPNRKICEKVEEIGSLIASRRVCMTARQWENQRRRESGKKPQGTGTQNGR